MALKVGLDLDGVCYDFNKSYRDYLINAGHISHEQAGGESDWHFYRAWGWTDQQFMDHFIEGVNKRIIFGGEAYPGVRDALQEIVDAGHTLHVVTDRSIGNPGVAAALTYEFLASELPPVTSVTFTRDKTIANVDIMIDDKVENYDALFEAGYEVYLLDRPWNQDSRDNRVRARVHSLAEYAQVVSHEDNRVCV